MNFRRSISQFINTRKLHAVSIQGDEESEKIFFCSDGKEIDINHAHALITLNPFSIAVNSTVVDFSEDVNPLLKVYDGEKEIGRLILKLDKVIKVSNLSLNIYEAQLPDHAFSITERFWNSLLIGIKNKTNKKSKRFVVPPRELLKLFVYTMKPRPVYLVSIAHEKGFDVFPIDILGEMNEEVVLLSIRSTSAAIPHIIETKKVCASTVPFSRREESYRFGGHHPEGVLPIELNQFKFISSNLLKIPIPDFAVSVQELTVEDTFKKGIHTQFVTRRINQYKLTNEPQLAHTPWFNEKYFRGKFGNRK